MNRTDRLHALHEALRRHADVAVTAQVLAGSFEVSTRTIKRDITALQEAGAPIWSQQGPGGGYRIDASATMPPVAFTPSQAVAAAVALAVLPDGSPFGADARAAASKLLDTLGPVARERAATLSARIWVLHEPDQHPPPQRNLRAIERSITDNVALSIVYDSPSGERTQRTIEPIMIAWGNRRWYVVAYCRLRDAVRWFRFDRIEQARDTHETYRPRPIDDIGEPPDGASSIAP